MNYHNITKDDMLNGDGLRVVLWVSGCNHYCRECQNPITWDPNGGLPFDEAAKKELMDELKKDYYSGVTLSGGDPLYPGNRAEVMALAREIRETMPEKTIWLYTGFTWEQIRSIPGIENIDVIVDGEFLIEKKDTQLLWRGSPNQRVIRVRETLASGQVVLHVDPDAKAGV